MKFLRSNAFKAFLLSFFIGALIIVPTIVAQRGIYTVFGDFNYQQIPFNMLINDSIKDGSYLYTWFNDLGSNFLSTFSFYNLFSPFNILGYFFPSNWFPYLIGPIYILKYAVAGLTSYMFLSRYVKNKKYAIFGSILYSFSGFQLTNTLFYHFHDVVAFFPLFLYALDRLVLDNKKGIFALTTALIAFTNWYFFIQQVVFVIIYYIVKVITKHYDFNFKKFMQIIIEGILGTGIAMLVLLPSAIFTAGNPRVDGSWTLKNALFYETGRYFDIIRSLIMPCDTLKSRSTFFEINWQSTEAFLPLVGSYFVIIYLIKKPKDFFSILFFICLIFMFIPILNNSFYLFTNTYYSRWFYMPILIMCCITIKALDEKLDCSRGLNNIIIMFTVLIIGIIFLQNFLDEDGIIKNNIFMIKTAIFFISLLITNKIANNKKIDKLECLTYSVILFIFIMGNLIQMEYKKDDIGFKAYKESFLKSPKLINIKTDSYRLDATTDLFLNLGYINKLPIIKSFNSNITPAAFDFYKSVDITRGVKTTIGIEDAEIRNFLSVKYLLSETDKPEITSYYNGLYKRIDSNDYYQIYENKDAIPMGILYEYYMLEDDYMAEPKKTRQALLDDVVVLNKKQAKKYSNYLKKYDNQNKNNYIVDSSFKFEKNGFEASIDNTRKGIVLYTIPYDKGWNITLNNKQVKYDKSSNGFIILPIEKGFNTIEGNYFPEGLKLGLYISCGSLVMFIIYMNKKFFNKKK